MQSYPKFAPKVAKVEAVQLLQFYTTVMLLELARRDQAVFDRRPGLI